MITQQIKLAACIIAAVVTTAVQAQGEESADVLGTKKWGAGPTAVVLKQTGPWTYACWRIISGPLRVTVTVAMSTRPFSSPS